MAATDLKITSTDINAVHVEAQPTVLQGSVSDNKKVFDAYSDMIVEHFNGLCDFVADDTSAEIDNTVLALFVADGWTPEE